MKTRPATIAAKPHLEQYVRAPSPAAFHRQHTTQGEAFAQVSSREGNSSGVEGHIRLIAKRETIKSWREIVTAKHETTVSWHETTINMMKSKIEDS